MKTMLVLTAAALAVGCAPADELPESIPPVEGARQVAFALRQIDVVQGIGAAAEPRKCMYVHYTGWFTDGTKFDSSRDTTASGQPRTPIAFPQGARRVIAGWDLGFEGMRVGSQRRLFIPYQLAYGERGRPPVIPERAELIFDVELMAIADTLPASAAAQDPRPPQGPRCPEWAVVSGATG
ncbi:MAG: FKBP-type peptidyl-prolyl cis-trans isomerase [Gemmatimonadaceae bacterium]